MLCINCTNHEIPLYFFRTNHNLTFFVVLIKTSQLFSFGFKSISHKHPILNYETLGRLVGTISFGLLYQLKRPLHVVLCVNASKYRIQLNWSTRMVWRYGFYAIKRRQANTLHRKHAYKQCRTTAKNRNSKQTAKNTQQFTTTNAKRQTQWRLGLWRHINTRSTHQTKNERLKRNAYGIMLKMKRDNAIGGEYMKRTERWKPAYNNSCETKWIRDKKK